VNHTNLAAIPLVEAQKEIIDSRLALERALGRSIVYMAYPYGGFNRNVIAFVHQAGFRLAFSTLGGNKQTAADQFTIRRLSVSGDYSLDTFASLINTK